MNKSCRRDPHKVQVARNVTLNQLSQEVVVTSFIVFDESTVKPWAVVALFLACVIVVAVVHVVAVLQVLLLCSNVADVSFVCNLV